MQRALARGRRRATARGHHLLRRRDARHLGRAQRPRAGALVAARRRPAEPNRPARALRPRPRCGRGTGDRGRHDDRGDRQGPRADRGAAAPSWPPADDPARHRPGRRDRGGPVLGSPRADHPYRHSPARHEAAGDRPDGACRSGTADGHGLRCPRRPRGTHLAPRPAYRPCRPDRGPARGLSAARRICPAGSSSCPARWSRRGKAPR